MWKGETETPAVVLNTSHTDLTRDVLKRAVLRPPQDSHIRRTGKGSDTEVVFISILHRNQQNGYM